jgi:hypothetical protein
MQPQQRALHDVPERAAQEEQAPIDAEADAETARQSEAEPAEKKETQWHKAAVEAMRKLTVTAAQPRLAAIAAADAATHRELEHLAPSGIEVLTIAGSMLYFIDRGGRAR